MEKSMMYKYGIFAGVIMAGCGIVLSDMSSYGTIITGMGVTIAVIMVIRLRNISGGITRDERTLMLDAKAVSYSWFYTFITINVLFWIDYVGAVELSLSSVLALLFFEMIFSLTGVQYYFRFREAADENAD